MTEAPHVPAAFINAIREEGTKREACDWLQKMWNEKCALEDQIAAQREAALRDMAEFDGKLLTQPDLPAAVTVKPLEWEEASLSGWKRGRCAAKSPLSTGWAAYIKRVEGGWEYAGNIYSSALDGLDVALDCAKIQAQADYKRRIMSCITTQPDPVKGVARPDVWAQSLCRELRQQDYLVPYLVMMQAIQNAALTQQEQSE